MREILTKKLHQYLVQNHLDMLISLQQDSKVTLYLDEKVESVKELYDRLREEKRPEYVIEALCMEEMTASLRPSRFEYIRLLLEDEFELTHHQMRDCGTLTYEIIDLIGICQPVFDEFSFAEDNREDRALRYLIIGMVQEYLSR